MELEERENDTVVTQVSFGGFGSHVTAKELVSYLEDEIGLVFRCRLKTSWTPLESVPNFEISDAADIETTDDYRKVEPHAFVHFASPESVTAVMDAVGCCQLFFNNQALKASLGPENLFNMNKRRRTKIPFKLDDVRLEIGSLVRLDEFFVAWKGPDHGVDFVVNPFDGTCKFCFRRDTAFSFKGLNKHAVITCDFKAEFQVREIVLFDLLDDDDPWIRTTDFTPTGAIGRCNYYRVLIPPRHGAKLKKAMIYLKERRVQEVFIKKPPRIQDEPGFGIPMSDPFFSIHYQKNISFDILFLVNAVMHKGILNQHQLSDSFFDLLRNQPEEINVAALKHLCSYKHPVFDASKRLKLVQEWLLRNPKLIKNPKRLDDIAEVRRLVITPTKAYCLPPEVELSNRVLRKYKEVADRFLRVTFMDEGMQTMNSNVMNSYVAPIVKEITENTFPQKTKVYVRIRAILMNGFHLCGRKYSFLAFSSNQLMDRSAWFFAEDKTISIQGIKHWMGRFTNRNVAKCTARMGQCFSSTYATVEVPSTQVNPKLPEIVRNGYVFSDGIGRITPDLAMEVAEKLKLDRDPPSAYQIRYGGCKGVVACWPPTGFLNRQIITLLSALDVPDEIFWTMQETMVSKLKQMLVATDVAFDVLTASCAEQGNSAAIMLSAGFKPQTEPHLRGMLTCIQAAQLWGLREKTRIFVPSGRWLMGCLDELGVLEQGQCFVQVSMPSLENCFAKHGSRFDQTDKNLQVIKGFVVVAKNPCLHPGDIRILEAVDAPGLHHLHDCLVFPQKGHRPHTDEASGSDLDGDLYFFTWDENLIPPLKKSSQPMEYEPAEAKLSGRRVTSQDLIEFFVRNMVNENLGAICNAHVVHSDRSEYGAFDENCLKLAELAAAAVDFPKTGKIVTMPPHLKPKLYPDFMGKQDYQSYKSNKILGRLYRKICDAYDEDVATSSEQNHVPSDVKYDMDLEVPKATDFIADAWERKCSYDSQLQGLMTQYKIMREEEIVTGHVWSMPKYTSRKQGELQERLKHSYSALKKEFRQFFEKRDTGFESLTDDQKNSFYEQKASARYQVTYHPDWVKKSLDLHGPDGPGDVVMLSFAWIAADYLARIKIKRREVSNIDPKKPINILTKYLADRI
ncbi:hypothetical protein ACLB2K_017294 [Fragaria x ananassa]